MMTNETLRDRGLQAAAGRPETAHNPRRLR